MQAQPSLVVSVVVVLSSFALSGVDVSVSMRRSDWRVIRGVVWIELLCLLGSAMVSFSMGGSIVQSYMVPRKVTSCMPL